MYLSPAIWNQLDHASGVNIWLGINGRAGDYSMAISLLHMQQCFLGFFFRYVWPNTAYTVVGCGAHYCTYSSVTLDVGLTCAHIAVLYWMWGSLGTYDSVILDVGLTTAHIAVFYIRRGELTTAHIRLGLSSQQPYQMSRYLLFFIYNRISYKILNFNYNSQIATQRNV